MRPLGAQRIESTPMGVGRQSDEFVRSTIGSISAALESGLCSSPGEERGFVSRTAAGISPA